ncbi:unnamed protein product [Clavelina lepadiformis]|uniref:Uncharacterized protein n=1 Tax=Clavelina lepadiformis TaxID=159417 RepID=A0ABP0FNT1_CLALP
MPSEIVHEKEKLRQRCIFFFAAVFSTSTVVHGTFSILSHLQFEEGYGTTPFAMFYATSLAFTAFVPVLQKCVSALVISIAGQLCYGLILNAYFDDRNFALSATVSLALGDALFGSTVLVLKGIFARKWAKIANVPVDETRRYFTGLLFVAHQLGMLTGNALSLGILFIDHATSSNMGNFPPTNQAFCSVKDHHQHHIVTDDSVYQYTPYISATQTLLSLTFVVIFSCAFMSLLYAGVVATRFNEVDDLGQVEDKNPFSGEESIPLRIMAPGNNIVEEMNPTTYHETAPDNQYTAGLPSRSQNKDLSRSMASAVPFVEETSPVLSNEHRLRLQEPPFYIRIKNLYKTMVRLTFTRRHLLVMPLPIYTGMLIAFVLSELPQSFACFLGLHQVVLGLVLCCLAGSIFSFGIVIAPGRHDRNVCIALALLLDLPIYYFCFHWHTVEDNPSLIFVLFPVIGACAGIWKVISNDIYAHHFKGEEKIAHTMWNFWKLAGMCIQFSINIPLSMNDKALVRLTVLLVAIVFYAISFSCYGNRRDQRPRGDGQIFSEQRSTHTQQVEGVATSWIYNHNAFCRAQF